MVKNIDRAGQWPVIARLWQQIGSPLRPAAEDIRFFMSVLNDWLQLGKKSPPQALILGVTPELYHLPWPTGTHLNAIDRTQAMIEHVWPGSVDDVTHADWLKMPYPEASMDLVLCDGGLHLLAYPEEQNTLAIKLARIMAPDGYCAFRLFVPPTVSESPNEVMAALFAGDIADLNCLKLRLGMALQQQSVEGVKLDDVWQTLHAAEPNQEKLANRLEWDLDHLRAIDAYRGAPARYHFVSVDEAIAIFCDGTGGAFQVHRLDWPSYRMGSQCPTIVFKRRQD